ncbi:hypothetical protein HMPREF1287_00460 [Corynebacterium sp. KPL1986]|nr:hypothetical protein HMPREF1287_00460 [Corynebacterium sp. KPL1986]
MKARTIATPATPVSASASASAAWTSPIATTGTAEAATSGGIAFQPQRGSSRGFRGRGSERPGTDVVDYIGVLVGTLHELEGAGGQPDDRILAKNLPCQARIQVVLADVYAVDIVVTHQRGGHVDSVIDKHPRCWIGLFDRRRHVDSKRGQIAHANGLAANLNHARATGCCRCGNLHALLLRYTRHVVTPQIQLLSAHCVPLLPFPDPRLLLWPRCGSDTAWNPRGGIPRPFLLRLRHL